MKRTDEQIQEQINGLKAIKAKPTFHKVTFFGDSNADAIDAQIETLERRFDLDTVYAREGEEWSGHAVNSAVDAANWLSGDEDESLVDGWKGLY